MPKTEDKQYDWLNLQLRGTQNVSTGAFADWFTGHLNYQIEHHLFPNMPRHRYPEIREDVKALCKKHNVPYTTTTIWHSCVEVVDKLRSVAAKYNAAIKSSKLQN